MVEYAIQYAHPCNIAESIIANLEVSILLVSGQWLAAEHVDGSLHFPTSDVLLTSYCVYSTVLPPQLKVMALNTSDRVDVSSSSRSPPIASCPQQSHALTRRGGRDTVGQSEAGASMRKVATQRFG